MPTLNVDGDKLHYFDEGTGVPIIFVHGSCGGARQWRALAAGLKEDYRAVCLDLFGSGESQSWPIERKWTAQDDGRAIDAILDLLGEPAHFVIHSGGGHFAYPTIRHRPQNIRSLTFFEPVYFHLLRETGDPLFAQPEEMANRYREALDDGNREQAMAGFVDAWAGSDGAWNALPDQIKSAMKVGSDRLYHEWTTNWHEQPTRQDLANLDIPALLFKGTETIESMHRVCEIVRDSLTTCSYVEIEGAGHMSPFTHAAQVLPSVRAHLATSVR